MLHIPRADGDSVWEVLETVSVSLVRSLPVGGELLLLYSNKFNLASGGEAWIKHTRFIRGRLEMKDILPEN